MSKINGCQLDRVGELPFDFYYGACTNFIARSEKILLCFDSYDREGRDTQLKTCHIFDGMNFESGPSTKYRHQMTTGMALYRNRPFVTGSLETNARTEILDIDILAWTQAKDYPFSAQ